jgi:hypothetical protein
VKSVKTASRVNNVNRKKPESRANSRKRVVNGHNVCVKRRRKPC